MPGLCGHLHFFWNNNTSGIMCLISELEYGAFEAQVWWSSQNSAKIKAERQPRVSCADNDTGHLPERKNAEVSPGRKTENPPPVKLPSAGGSLFCRDKRKYPKSTSEKQDMASLQLLHQQKNTWKDSLMTAKFQWTTTLPNSRSADSASTRRIRSQSETVWLF